MTLEPTNEDRAEWGRLALIAFTTQVCPSDRKLSEDDPVDLVVNLCHYMRREGLDPYGKIKWALWHFEVDEKENVA